MIISIINAIIIIKARGQDRSRGAGIHSGQRFSLERRPHPCSYGGVRDVNPNHPLQLSVSEFSLLITIIITTVSNVIIYLGNY